MSDRDFVIELVTRLPKNAPLEQIASQIELLAGINVARAQARKGEGIPAGETRKLVEGRVSR